MKKLLLIFILFASCFNMNGQIQLAYTSPVGKIGHVGILHLYFAGNKFVERNDSLNTITLYNSDLSVYKTINFPALPFNSPNSRWVHYLTESLFDTDSTDLEYLLYYDDTAGVFNVGVYDESGSLLFQRDSATSYPHFGNMSNGIHPYSSEIDYIDSIFYLRVHTRGVTEFYQLPGVIPCFDPCSNADIGLSTGLNHGVNIPLFYLSDPVPNPATNETEISYNLPPKVQSGSIVIYDQQGRRFKEIPVYPSVNKIIISMDGFKTGVYYYNLIWEGNAPASNRKLIVVK